MMKNWSLNIQRRKKYEQLFSFLSSTSCISQPNTEKSSKDAVLRADFKTASDEVVF